MNQVLYLSFDSLQEGVGVSQVLAYMRKVQSFTQVTIISFEKEMPLKSEVTKLESTGIRWIALPFGRFGPLGGLNRVFRMWLRVDQSKIIHARSTLPALAALLRFPRFWIWDCRSLQADQRRALSRKKRANLTFVLMRIVEYILAKKASSIIVITNAVIPVMLKRYQINKSKFHVIPTCVDVNKFQPLHAAQSKKIRILFAGTFSSAYDFELTNKIIRELKQSQKVEVTVAASLGSTELWKQLDYDFLTSTPHLEMPKLIQKHDVGISLWKNDLGICLSSVASTKTAEFLACGKPVIINSLQGDFGNLILDHRAGIVTSGSTESAVKDYSRQLIELLSDNKTSARCRALAVNNFNLDQGVLELIRIYQES